MANDQWAIPSTSNGCGAPPIHFSTYSLPERERVAAYQDCLGRGLLNVEIEIPDNERFYAEAAFYSLPGLSVVSAAASAMRGIRTKSLIAEQSEEQVVFTVSTQGEMHLTWFDNEMCATAGEAALMPSYECASVGLPHGGTVIMYGIAVDVLKPLVPSVGACLFKRIPHTGEALRLLVNYTKLLLGSEPALAAELRQATAAHMRELIALALGPCRDTIATAEKGGLRAARLHKIKTDVTNNAASPELSVGSVARRHGLSPRSIQLMFEAEGTTFSQFVLERRLTLAHQALVRWRGQRRSITDIALASGFSDVSYFNRVFRRRFGSSPTEVRTNQLN